MRAVRGGVRRPRARPAHGARAAAHAGVVSAAPQPHPVWAAAGGGRAGAWLRGRLAQRGHAATD